MKTGIHCTVPVPIKMLSDKAVMPTYESENAACCDLHSTINAIIEPDQTVLIPLGFALEVPEGFEFVIRPKLSISYKTGLSIRNSPGTVSADCRDELKLVIKNIGSENVTIRQGDVIAQGGPRPMYQANFKVVEEFSDGEE